MSTKLYGEPLTLLARAKINLHLSVLFRRPDGFHEVRTVFQAIDLSDELVLLPSTDGEIRLECDEPGIPVDSTNLVVRAALLLRRDSGSAAGASIRLNKRIPSMAGLGGGSSDGSAALVGLNTLWGLGFSREHLCALATEIGSDAPFFLWGGTAWGLGRGEEVIPMPDLPQLHVALVCPGIEVSTPWAYGRLTFLLTKDAALRNISLLRGIQGELSCVLQCGENDFERVVFPEYPVLAEAVGLLRDQGAIRVAMSGSGSALYGLFETREACACAVGAVGASFPGFRVRVARFVSRLEYLKGFGRS